jgi:hypothetical protein
MSNQHIVGFGTYCINTVLRIRIGFNAAFYLNADQDPWSQTNANPDSGLALPTQKAGFRSQKVIFYRQYVKEYTYLRRYKSHFERLEIRFICNFGQFPSFRIRIRICIPNTDPDSGNTVVYYYSVFLSMLIIFPRA